MVGKITPPELITAQEAIALLSATPAEYLFRAASIKENCVDLYGNKDTNSEILMLAVIYNTGRIQGIREERAKRKEGVNLG